MLFFKKNETYRSSQQNFGVQAMMRVKFVCRLLTANVSVHLKTFTTTTWVLLFSFIHTNTFLNWMFAVVCAYLWVLAIGANGCQLQFDASFVQTLSQRRLQRCSWWHFLSSVIERCTCASKIKTWLLYSIIYEFFGKKIIAEFFVSFFLLISIIWFDVDCVDVICCCVDRFVVGVNCAHAWARLANRTQINENCSKMLSLFVSLALIVVVLAGKQDGFNRGFAAVEENRVAHAESGRRIFDFCRFLILALFLFLQLVFHQILWFEIKY